MADTKKGISIPKRRAKIILLIIVILFAVLFLVKFIVEVSKSGRSSYTSSASYAIDAAVVQSMNGNGQVQSSSGGASYYNQMNIATKRIEKQVGVGTIKSVEQKYEKIAAIKTSSKSYDDDEKKIRDIITKFNAIIQFEKKVGLKPYRFLHLSIGVDPDKFDEIIAVFKAIGKTTSLNIDKTDKTSEFIGLNAKRKSLEKMRASLLRLKNRSGRIEEMVELEGKILEVEKSIQSLGATLGDYSAENEFCTIHISLSESHIVKRSIDIMQKLRVSLEWAIGVYIVGFIILLILCLGILLVIKIMAKLKWIPSVAKNQEGGK